MATNIVPAHDLTDLMESWVSAEMNGEQFPVPLHDHWNIAGHRNKQDAFNLVESLLEAGFDFLGSTLKNAGRGRGKKAMHLSVSALEHLCLAAHTEQGKSVRELYRQAKAKWDLTKKIAPQSAHDVELLCLQIELAKIELQRQQSNIENDRLRELVLINENLRMDLSRLERIDSMAILHGVPTTLTLMGREGSMVEVEKPTIEVIDDRHNQNTKYKGQTCTQLKDYMKSRFGIVFKSGADVQRVLEQKENELNISLVSQLPRNTCLQSYVNEENSEQAIAILRDVKSWQCLLGQ